jgi:nitrate/nitrite-specific signal transduction histidine kinase
MFTVCDDGPGFAAEFDPVTAAHTGLELVDNIARHDLRAEVCYENRSQGGGRVVVSFPLP